MNNSHSHENAPSSSTTALVWPSGALRVHVACMMLAFGVIFPLGMALGIGRSSWHWKVQLVGLIAAVVGLLAVTSHSHSHSHSHDDGVDIDERAGHSVHAAFGTLLLLVTFTQGAFGIMIKLIRRGQLYSLDYLVRLFVLYHRNIGRSLIVGSYVQIMLGFIILSDTCTPNWLNNCISHLAMGSSFVWYAGFAIARLGGFLQTPGYSMELWESIVITIWGVINSLLLNPEGNRENWQHVSMGIVFAMGGLLGLVLEWKTVKSIVHGRNIAPALVIIFVGRSMSSHTQHGSQFFIDIHDLFGLLLISGGLVRLAEVIFRGVALGGIDVSLPLAVLGNFFLLTAGLSFIAATHQSLTNMEPLLESASFANILVASGFLLVAFAFLLVGLASRRLSLDAPASNYTPLAGQNGDDNDIELSGSHSRLLSKTQKNDRNGNIPDRRMSVEEGENVQRDG